MKEMYSEMDRAELHSSDASYLKSQLLQIAEVPRLSSSSLLPNFMYPSMGLCRTRGSVQTPTSPCARLCSAQALQQPIRVPETKPGDSRSPHRDSHQQTLACNTGHPGHVLSLAQSTAPRESKYCTCSASSHKINV